MELRIYDTSCERETRMIFDRCNLRGVDVRPYRIEDRTVFLTRIGTIIVRSRNGWRVCILAAMGRKRIITFAVVAIIAVIVSASIYEAFDIHDPKPFPIDPEFLLMMLSSSLTVCLSVLLLTLPLFKLFLLIFDFLRHALKLAAYSGRDVFQDGRLLFSPPLSPISLRI